MKQHITKDKKNNKYSIEVYCVNCELKDTLSLEKETRFVEYDINRKSNIFLGSYCFKEGCSHATFITCKKCGCDTLIRRLKK